MQQKEKKPASRTHENPNPGRELRSIPTCIPSISLLISIFSFQYSQIRGLHDNAIFHLCVN